MAKHLIGNYRMGSFRVGFRVALFSGLGIRRLAIRMGLMRGQGIRLVVRRGLLIVLRRMVRGHAPMPILERRPRGIWATG